MTSRDIDRTLNLLLPTASSVPTQLTALATTLLAQSRAKAPNLKPEEEIARTYACCHIACERLRDKLGLEIGKSGAPCGPKIYRKLFGFLEGVLRDTPGTPRKRKAEDEGRMETPRRVGSASKRQAATPTSRAGTSKGGSATPKSGKEPRRARVEDQLPDWTMPLIRHLCDAYKTPKAATHVYAGVESVYNYELDQGLADQDRIVALICSIFAIVTAKSDCHDVADTKRKVGILATAAAYLKTVDSAAAVPTQAQTRKQYEGYVRSLDEWQNMEWYQHLPSQSGEADGDEERAIRTPKKQSAKTPLRRKEKHAQRELQDGEEPGAAGLLPGLGTMFQPAVDWLSDDRKRDFAAWKKDMLKEVALVESQG